MKRRPRRIEQKVAELLSEHLARFGPVSKVERIPVLGRTGPDIDILPVYRLAIDVKSRKAIPKKYELPKGTVAYWAGIDDISQPVIGTRLEDLHLLFDVESLITQWGKMTKDIEGWIDHMDQWCNTNKPVLPALVLHWPGRQVKMSTFIIYHGDRRTLHDRRERANDLQLRAGNYTPTSRSAGRN